jgi:hypothetical protein
MAAGSAPISSSRLQLTIDEDRRRSLSLDSIASTTDSSESLSTPRTPFDIPWTQGATMIQLYEQPEQYELLVQIQRLFKQSMDERTLWNLNSANLYLNSERKLTLIDSCPFPQFDMETLFLFAETYNCSPRDEIYNFITPCLP